MTAASPRYAEMPPPAHLAADVACLWAVETGGGHPAYRVLPDGCTDLLVQPTAGGGLVVEMVGAMTRHRDVALEPGRRVLGLRFRPGMAWRYLPVPAAEVADRSVPLTALSVPWARALAALAGPLGEPAAPAAALALLASGLAPHQPAGPVQRLCAWLAEAHGCVRIDDLAARSGYSARQLRRLFLAQVGMGPKQLARILRFQRAVEMARAAAQGAAAARKARDAHGARDAHEERAARPDWAGVAVDCGYADQAHLVHEFTALAGGTPGQIVGRGHGR